MKFFLFVFTFSSFHLCADSYVDRTRLKVQLNSGYYMMQVKTKATDNSAASSTSFSQIELRPTIHYFLTQKLSFGLYYFQTSFIEDFNSSGLGLEGRWYFLKRGSVEDLMVDNKKITIQPTWSPFIHGGMKRQTLEAETIDIKFNGMEVGAGVDRHLKDGYYLSFDFTFASLASGSSRTATSQSFLVGFGKSI